MNNKTSTSFHKLNYDKPLSKLNKILWFIFNLFNNFFINYNLDKNLKIKEFNYTKTKSYYSVVSFELSPLRLLSNLLLLSLPWKKILMNFGNLKILEIGSGTGKYGEFFNSLLNDNLECYTGVDIRKNSLKKIPDNFNFYIDTCDNVTKYIKNHNVLITMTAIEHFENDLLFFKKIRDYLDETKKELLQVHIMPAYPCLKTYLGHGLRQYSPRNLSKVTKLFNKSDTKILIPIGNNEFNKVTFKYITLPRIFKRVDRRKSEFNAYKNELISLLNNMKGNKKPTAYALIIGTNLKQNINFKNDQIN